MTSGVMNVEVDGMRVAIFDEHDRQAIHFASGKGYEQESLLAWAAMVQPRRVALDIGAYTGLFSIIAAKRGAEVVALEPMPANRWRLGVNADLNKVRINVLPVAASDSIGSTYLFYNQKVPLTTGASLEPGIAAHNGMINVSTVTIDALALTNVAAIKIDVERHEPCVIRGALATIERDKPTMLIETLDDGMRIAVAALLPGYEIAAILDGRNTLFKPR